jgi:D-alanyl-D-alanine carboxypeptidase
MIKTFRWPRTRPGSAAAFGAMTVVSAVTVVFAVVSAVAVARPHADHSAVRAAQDTEPVAAGVKTTVATQLDDLVRNKVITAALIRVGGRGADWTAAAGRADITSGRPANAAGYFRIGSITKTFVATVLLQLSDEGRLRLDDPIERHLPGLVPDGEHITIRRLLDHTSGLYDYAHEPGYSTNRWRGADRFRTYRPRQLLEIAFAHPPNFPPGTGWRYSNTNYIPAALLIEKLTGRPYGEEITRRILRPLRLTQTIIPGTRPGLPPPHAHGYEILPNGRTVDATRMNPSLDWAAGEMISTTRDLGRFFDALLGRRLTSKTALTAMRTTTATQAGYEYGLGLQKYTLPCGTTLWGHGGELTGYLTFAFRADNGRQMTISINPYTRNPSTTEMFAIAGAVFCR